MSPKFSCDLGSGLATFAIHANWQRDLTHCHDVLGFCHVQFHGVLSDNKETLINQNNQLLHSLHMCLLSIGMKSFVELSVMPLALSSSDPVVFHYKANITPPRDYGQWADMIGAPVNVWFVEGDARLCLLLVNLALLYHAITAQNVTIALTGTENIAHARIWYIDADQANAIGLWQMMCARDYLTPSDLATLQEASRLVWWPQDVNIAQGIATVEVTPQPQSVTAVEILGARRPL